MRIEQELAESQYLSEHPGATYQQVRDFANQLYAWSATIPARTAGDLATTWGEENGHGAIVGFRKTREDAQQAQYQLDRRLVIQKATQQGQPPWTASGACNLTSSISNGRRQ